MVRTLEDESYKTDVDRRAKSLRHIGEFRYSRSKKTGESLSTATKEDSVFWSTPFTGRTADKDQGVWLKKYGKRRGKLV